MRLLTTLLLVPLLAAFVVACDGDDDDDETPTSIPTIVAPSEVPGSPTVAPSVTTPPAATDTPEPADTAQPTQPPTDGTVFPQNPGATDPYTIKSNPDPTALTYILTDVRVGAHPESGGWDRIVFEFEDYPDFPMAHPGGMVEYVDEASQCGSGMPVEVEGEVILAVRFDATQAHDDNGQLTIDGTEIDGPGNSILEAASYCDFEGVVQWAIGVPGEQNFKVTTLQNPSRVVIDIKWP